MFGLLAGTGSISSTQAQATGPDPSQKLFATPDDAVKALQAATAAKDKAALREIFGPQVDELMTGDAVQDANNAQHFANAMAEGCNPVKDDSGNITLEVGTNNWPMPIPLGRTRPRARRKRWPKGRQSSGLSAPRLLVILGRRV